LAWDATIPARDATTKAREAANSATEVTNAARNKPTNHDKKSLVLMTWNASRLLSSGRELALLHLLTSLAVDIATVTECKMTETANDFAVAGYTTYLPIVPKGKSKTRVIILVKNDLVTSANVHLCRDLMDSQTQPVWLRFGPVSSMGGFTLCGVYRTWSDHDGHVFNVPEATERLEALSSQITRAAKRYTRVVVHGDLNLDLDRSGDRLYARKSLLTALLERTEAAGLETHQTPPTWHSYGIHRVRLNEVGSRPGVRGDQPGNERVRLGKGGDHPGNGRVRLGNGTDHTDARRSHAARLDHVYTRGFPHATSQVLEDNTTDHHPVLTLIESGK
jgi:exonuclease III